MGLPWAAGTDFNLKFNFSALNFHPSLSQSCINTAVADLNERTFNCTKTMVKPCVARAPTNIHVEGSDAVQMCAAARMRKR